MFIIKIITLTFSTRYRILPGPYFPAYPPTIRCEEVRNEIRTQQAQYDLTLIAYAACIKIVCITSTTEHFFYIRSGADNPSRDSVFCKTICAA